jgi:hypothetical protein
MLRKYIAWGWVLSIVLTLVLFLVLLPEANVDTTPTESDADVNKVVVPMNPGLQRAEAICEDGEIQSQEARGIEPPPPETVYEYIATLGADRLYFKDTGAGHRVGLINGESVTLSDEVLECLRDSR